MKKKVFIISIILAVFTVGVALGAYTKKTKFVHIPKFREVYVTQLLTLSADDSAVDLDNSLVGGYLFSVEILSSADDAVTFSINSNIGTELFTDTTTAATSGEISNPSGYWPINATPNYTLSGLGSGTIEIEITVAKR